MRTAAYLCSIPVLVVASTAYAQTDSLRNLGLPDSAATQIKQAAPRVRDGSGGKVDHLEQAADHLEAAGHNDEARRLRSQATLLRNQKQLKQKLKALHELQHEVRELYRLTGVGQQIQVRVKLIELDLEKLEEDRVKLREFNVEALKCNNCKSGACSIGTDIDQAASGRKTECGTCKQPEPDRLFDKHGQFTATARRLRKAGILKVIAEPSLMTIPGQPANLLTGGEFPILVPQEAGETNIEWREFGTRVETVTAVMPDGRVRVEIQIEVSHRDFNNAVNVNGSLVPGLTSRRVNTHVLAESGETTLIGGQVALQTQEKCKDRKTCKKCLAVAVTPTLLSVSPVNPDESATESDGSP